MSGLGNWFASVDQQYHKNEFPTICQFSHPKCELHCLTPFLAAVGLQHTWTLHISYNILCKRRETKLAFILSHNSKGKKKEKENQPSSSQYINKYLLTFHWLGITGPFLNFPFGRTVCIDWRRPGFTWTNNQGIGDRLTLIMLHGGPPHSWSWEWDQFHSLQTLWLLNNGEDMAWILGWEWYQSL